MWRPAPILVDRELDPLSVRRGDQAAGRRQIGRERLLAQDVAAGGEGLFDDRRAFGRPRRHVDDLDTCGEQLVDIGVDRRIRVVLRTAPLGEAWIQVA